MSEVYLPSLPEFEVNCDIEFCIDKKEVYFSLALGILDVICVMSAKVCTGLFDVAPASGNPEHSRDCEFKWLEVGKTAVSVDQSDIDIQTGQKLLLTEKQIQDLNKMLKDEMVMV